MSQSPPAAQRDDSLATNPSAGVVAEDHPPKRRRGGWGRAGVFAVVACLVWLACPTAAFAQTNTISIVSVAGNNVVTASEKWNGFKITGHTGNQFTIPVEVTFGTETWNTTSTTLMDGNYWWSVTVEDDETGNPSYITDGDNQTVNAEASFSGGIKLSHSRTFNVDLTLPLVVDAVTGDDVINDGVIRIEGNTGDIGSVRIDLVIGTGSFINTSELDGEWLQTVSAAENQSHITGSSASLSVTATKTGYEQSATVSRTLTKDLVHPSVSYTAPLSLQVGVEITPITPTTSDTDIVSYLFSNPLPGLSLNGVTGVISGTPTTVNDSTRRSTVIATDAADNDGTATIDFPPVVAGTLTLNVDDDIAGDDTINIAEKASGFTISGDTGTESGVTVAVTMDGTTLTATSGIPAGETIAEWSVTVGPNENDIMEANVSLSVTATKTNYTSVTVTRTLDVDLTATVSYDTVPSSLEVGEAITAMVPTTNDTDIDSYAISSGSLPLPRGLSLNGTKGVISGTPTTGNPNTETVAVLATDKAGNTGTADIQFPAVDGPEAGVTDWRLDPLMPLPVPEGGSAQYTLVLDTEPTHAVTITVNSPVGDEDLTAAPTSLTFTPGNWNAEQTVTVSAVEDADGMAGIRNFSHKVVSTDGIYDDIPAPGVRAVEADNDEIGVTIWPQVLRMPDGGSREYRVVLNTQPTDDVTITVKQDQGGDDDLTAFPDTLIFTKETWDTPQTVKVSAAADDDQVNDVAVFSHSVESADENYQSDDEVTIAPVTVTVDETRPRVEIQTEASATVSGAFKVTIRFSEPVDGFELEDIEVSNGTASNFTQIWKGEYTVTITPRESGEVKVMVKSNAARDAVGNGNRAAEPLIIEADLERPVVAIASAAVGPVAGAFEVTITFSEAVTGFEQHEITVTNGSVTGFGGSETSYTAEITPSQSGEVTVEVGAEVAEDAAGDGNRAAEPLIIEADLERPVVAIASAAVGPVAGAFEVTITFSEAVTGFEQHEITVTNGSVTGFGGSETSYTAEITPSQSGEVTVEVGAEVAEDAAGDGNRAAEPLIVEVDLERPVVAIASAAVGPVVGAFEVTITFNEAVTGFEQSDIQVTNGTVTGFGGSETSYTAEITPSQSGEVTVEVGAEVAEDAAGDGNRAAEPLIIEADLERPVVAIASAAVGPVAGAFEVTITFNEAVTGFEQSDIQVTNGTVTDFSGSGTSYTAEITPTESGEVTVEVGAEVAEDAAGNGNRAAEPWIVEVDLERPVVAIASAAVGPVAGAFEVTITFNEAVTGFEQSDIQVTNGTVTDFSGSGTSYTAEITPTESGEVTVEVGAEVAEDAAGNGNRAAEPWIVEVDLERPVVAIASAAVGPVVGAFEVTITFNEAVTGFEQSDIQVTNGTVTDFSGSGTSYTAEITPTESGEVTVEVGAEVAEDAAGNGNRAAEPWIVEVDLERPVVAIASAAVGPVVGAFEVTITFNEAVTGFEQSDIQVTNGTVTDFSGSGTSYTAEITPTESGEVTVEVGAEVAEDAAGNGNRAAEPWIVEVDLERPVVAIASAAVGPVAGAFEVTITFNEAVTGFEQSDIQVTNGTVTDFSGSGTSYTAEITPSQSGEVTVEVGAKVAEDAAGNGNRAAEPLIIEADLERPVVAIASAAVGPVAGAFEVTITFNEAVTGFEQSDIQVTNGTVTDFSGSGTSYTAEITPSQSGEVTVEVGAKVAEDAAGNGNEAAAPFIIATGITVSYAADSYTATEGGEPVTVTVKLSQAADEVLTIPIRVTHPETTEVGDYQVEGLKGWDAEAGTGTLTYGAGETEQTFTIAANHDGDGDDETVELGIGELPEIVMAGEPAVAIVTLEDKGLVELEVRFGQAAYEVKEGEAAEIKVTVSPAADRRVELPLEVALQDGTTPEDYGGVPVSVVFESGESEGTISVEVLADEVNDPGEGIVLSLGALPEAVSAGDPASTEVHFGQRRTAEQFTSSLEAMLAVMGRSMGESAQTAIEGRFERHRQWSRLGSSSGAVSTPQPGRANRAAVLGAVESERVGSEGSGGRGAEGSLVEHAWGADQAGAAQTSAATGSDWNSEHRETGTPVSWLRNVVLGSFGNLARAAQSDSAMSTGYGMAPGGRVSGQDRLYGSGFGDARLGLGPEEFTGMRDQEPLPDAGTRDTGSAGYSPMLGQALNLSGASLEMSLGEGEEATSWVPVLWGQGDLQQFNGDLTRLGMNYGGGLEAAHLGLDLYANDKVLAGLSFMRSWGDLEYTDDGVAGLLESRMNTVHPYVYWQPSARLSVWGIGGLGQGQVEVEEPGRTHDFGAEFRMFAGGARAVLGGRGSNEWGVRADAFTTQLGTDALEDIAKVRGEAQRGRLMLEWVHDAELSVGRSLSLTAEAGGRIDRGDADRGAGMETGFRLGYLDAHSGLDVALHGRVLVVHESDYRDWGAGVQASWDPGEKQRGFRASVNSSLGQDGGGRTTLWDNADAVMRPAGIGAMGMGSQSRMESEVAYAGLKAPGLPGLLTPYGRLRRAGQGRELALGAAWSLTTGSQLALPATFELETIRRETSTGPADLALLAQMSIPF